LSSPTRLFWVFVEILAIALAIVLVAYTYSDYVSELVVSNYAFAK
jgi:hypothetical protein